MESESNSHGEISLHGDLTVRRAQQLREMVQATLAQHTSIVVRIAEDATVDAAFLQLLCSAHRTAASSGKDMRLDIGCASRLRQHLEYSGFVRHIGCKLDCNNNCIWVNGADRRATV